MTHDELLAKIDIEKANRYMPIDETANDDWLHIESVFNALRAVVELHKPFNDYVIDCVACGKEFPCPTIQAIEEELK